MVIFKKISKEALKSITEGEIERKIKAQFLKKWVEMLDKEILASIKGVGGKTPKGLLCKKREK